MVLSQHAEMCLCVCPLLFHLSGCCSDPVAAFPAIKAAILNTFSQYEKMTEREIQLDR